MLDLATSSFRGFDRRVWILVIGRVIASTGYSIVMPFLAIYLSGQLGMPMMTVGLLYLGMAVVGAIGQIVGGELADHLGRKSVMYTSMGLRALVFLLLSVVISLSWGFPAIALLVMGSAFFGSMFEPATNAIVADIVKPGRRMEAYGLLRVGANVGWSLGPLLGGFLAIFSYSSLFIFSSAASLSVAVIIIAKIAESNKREMGRERFHPRDILHVRENWHFMIFCLASIPLFVMAGQMTSTYAVFSEQVVGVSTVEVGYLFALNGLMVVFIQFPIARFLNKHTMTGAMAAGAIMYVVGYLLVGFSGDFLFLAACMFIITMGEMVTSPASMNLVANMSPDNERGRYMGVYGLFHSFGASAGPFIGGIFFDIWVGTPVFLWGAVAAVGALSVIGFFYLSSRVSDALDRVATNV